MPVVEAFGAACFPPPETWEHRYGLGVYSGCSFVEALTVISLDVPEGAQGRAYTITLENPTAASRQVFDDMLESIVFYPLSGQTTP